MKLLLLVLGVVCIVFGVLEAFMISPVDAFRRLLGGKHATDGVKKKWSLHNFASSSLRWVLIGLALLLLAYTYS